MKKLLLLVMAVAFVGLSTGCVYSTDGEKLSLVEDLPDTEKWQTETGTYMDVYVIYDQFILFWIPVWNGNVRYVLSSGDCMYLESQDPSNKNDLESKYGSPSSSIPFWDRFGGKLVWALILVGIFWHFFGGLFRSIENDPSPMATPPSEAGRTPE